MAITRSKCSVGEMKAKKVNFSPGDILLTHSPLPLLLKDLKAMCHYKTDFKPPSVLFSSTMKATKRRNVLWFRRRHERKFRIVLRHIVKDGNRALYFSCGIKEKRKKRKEKLFRESFWHLAIFCIHSLISLGNCS